MVLDIFQYRISWAFKEYPLFLSWTIRKRAICRKLSGACFECTMCDWDAIPKSQLARHKKSVNMNKQDLVFSVKL